MERENRKDALPAAPQISIELTQALVNWGNAKEDPAIEVQEDQIKAEQKIKSTSREVKNNAYRNTVR